MRRLGLALVIGVGLATPAVACINDSELPQHEREFRSDYGEPSPTPSEEGSPTYPTPRTLDLVGVPSNPILLGSGAALLTGAFFVSMSGRRTEKEK